ncbi:MAG: type II toxin-antitoxin system VapC family toxin [Verrucomicrobia bacterium]|nr:type II toxin-antitoxin system VapC family toxin [Verrucomicrobiota bacterium]
MRVFVDTSPWIYLCETSGPRRADTRTLLESWIKSGVELVTSTMTLSEVLVVPKREQRPDVERLYRVLFDEILSAPLIPLDESVADSTADIRAQYGFRTPDAIQLASALQNNCDAFFTNDRRLSRFDDIDIILLDKQT